MPNKHEHNKNKTPGVSFWLVFHFVQKYFQALAINRQPHKLLQQVFDKFRLIRKRLNRYTIIAANLILIIVFILISSNVSRAAYTTWTQSNWNGGVGSSTTNQYSAAANLNSSTSGNLTLAQQSNWFNPSWQYRSQVTFSNTAATIGITPTTLTNFPVLIKLTSANFNFAAAQSAGQDIRFTKLDGTSPLNYEIDYWNSSSQTASIWVDMPTIDANTTTEGLYMYYGNPIATDGQNKTAVWNSNYLNVLHMGETSGTTLTDSTTNIQNYTKEGASDPAPISTGKIGGAQSFNGTTDYALSGSYGSQPSSWTTSVWFNATNSSGVVLAWLGQGSINTSYHDSAIELVNGKVYIRAWSQPCLQIGNVSTGSWDNVAITYNSSNNAMTGYLNGAQGGSETGALSPPSSLYIQLGGADSTQCGSGAYFNGAIDEYRYSNTALPPAWIAADYANQNSQLASYGAAQPQYATSGILTSAIYNTLIENNWGDMSYSATMPSGTAVSVLVRAGNQANLSDAPAFSSCSPIAQGGAITSTCAPSKRQYVQYQVTLSTINPANSPDLTSLSVQFTPSDITPPPVNASSISMQNGYGGAIVVSNSWANTDPYFSWTAGQDDVGGSGIQGYCLYLGQDPTADPVTTKGDLGTSPINTGGACQFAVAADSVNTALAGYIGTPLTSSNSPYYLNIKAIDNADNVYTGTPAQFQFRFDNTPPNNPAFITAPSEFVSNDQVDLTWPTSGIDAANDSNSGVSGLQYRIGNNGTWYGANHNGDQDMTDLLPNNGSYTTISNPDFGNLVQGNNIVYFRTWDTAGNVSAAYVTTVIKINSTAPSSPQNLTATPTSNTNNSFAFSWLAPASYTGSLSNIKYCYTVNILPTSSNCTFTALGQTSLSAGAYATEPGDNTLYLVAQDEAGNINYATAASVTFTANTPAPGIPLNLNVADISIKSTQTWELALSWDEPSSVGAGIATYKVFRSIDDVDFSNVADTAGTSYVDSGLQQQTYYYKIEACDSANNCGGFTSIVSDLPTGKFISPANLLSGPTVSVETRSATINWFTDRGSDSRVEYGLASGVYSTTEAANSDQVIAHSITLSNLNAGTTYYFRAQWGDVDGNVGTSSEETFTTLPAPTISNVTVTGINLTSATIEFTSDYATSVELEYGGGSGLGATQTQNTSTNTSTYSIPLNGLTSGTTYTFKLNPYDTSGNIYASPATYTLTTPPTPVITNVRFSPVNGALTGTEQVTWTTNVPASSQISYGLVGGPQQEAIDTTMVTSHSMTVSNLNYDTQYSLTANSVDNLGNIATSDLQVFESGTDTRPPIISGVTIQPSIVGNGASASGQLIVSWKTDKAGSSQVGYGQGISGDYTTKTAENTAIVNNHVVVVTGLSTSEIYHIEVISYDAHGIRGSSGGYTTIIGQASDNALSIVFNSLQEIFGL